VELSERLLSLESRLIWSLAAQRATADAALDAASRRLLASCPGPGLREHRSDIGIAATRLRRAVSDRVSRGKYSVAVSGDVLAALDPTAVLQRGYAALQRAEDRQPVFSVTQAATGTRIVAFLADGALESSVDVTLLRSPSGVVPR
jgi:exodeoxyribonuclease VII large subunit